MGEDEAAEHLAGVERLAKDLGLHSVRMGAADIDGIWRGKRVSMAHFLAHGRRVGVDLCGAVLGVDVADEIVPGLAYTGWGGGFPDVRLVPDLATFAPLSWAPGTAGVICDFIEADGTPTAVAPRQVLRGVLARARELGLEVRIGYELEFHLFRENPEQARLKGFQDLTPLAPGTRTYNLSRLAELESVLGDIVARLTASGIAVEAVNTEYGPSQFEISLAHTEALRAADQALIYKHAVREIAAGHGLTATFMARYDTAFAGSGGHLHQSLVDGAGANVFAPRARAGALAEPGLHFLAGQLATMAELTAVFCPNVNSYKRRTDASFAPLTATWGVDNRTTALRVPASEPGGARVEHRLPGADANPYLAIAAAVAGGLHGMAHRVQPPPTAGNAYALGPLEAVTLPATLDEAIERLQDGKLARRLLGAEFVEHFLATRRHELAAARAAVTDWERRRYFELV